MGTMYLYAINPSFLGSSGTISKSLLHRMATALGAKIMIVPTEEAISKPATE